MLEGSKLQHCVIFWTNWKCTALCSTMVPCSSSALGFETFLLGQPAGTQLSAFPSLRRNHTEDPHFHVSFHEEESSPGIVRDRQIVSQICPRHSGCFRAAGSPKLQTKAAVFPLIPDFQEILVRRILWRSAVQLSSPKLDHVMFSHVELCILLRTET